MSPSRNDGRAAAAARTAIMDALMQDHRQVRKSYRAFQQLDVHANPQAALAIVQQVLDELTVHAALEEELLYPAAHDTLDDDHLVDEAEVEHEALHTLIDQLHGMSPDEDKYAARFTVLCEYVLHHAKEEEGRLFPALAAAPMDWTTLADAMAARRRELMPAGSQGAEDGASGRPRPPRTDLPEKSKESSDDLSMPSQGHAAVKSPRNSQNQRVTPAPQRRARTA